MIVPEWKHPWKIILYTKQVSGVMWSRRTVYMRDSFFFIQDVSFGQVLGQSHGSKRNVQRLCSVNDVLHSFCDHTSLYFPHLQKNFTAQLWLGQITTDEFTARKSLLCWVTRKNFLLPWSPFLNVRGADLACLPCWFWSYIGKRKGQNLLRTKCAMPGCSTLWRFSSSVEPAVLQPTIQRLTRVHTYLAVHLCTCITG